MPLTKFHPVIARWFTERFQNPTQAQVRGWESIRRGQHTLIAAPTGSGKTLAAFLSTIDDLHREGCSQELPDEVRVVYVSPLKALSTDIHKNLAEPRREIRQLAQDLGQPAPKITAAVRTGDTPSSQRAAMVRTPPHILVTTPESLYILLTAERSRNMLRTVRTVIVDEVHAVIESRRGAHLALTLERLQHVIGQPLQRIGLSATQRPIETVAEFLIGRDGANGNRGACNIVDEGHQRTLDLALEIPESPLEAVMSGDAWEEIYDRLAQLVAKHETTLVFANTRRMVERVARHLSDRLGKAAVTAHHGSLAKEVRLDAEERLKTGKLQALVATASLELGIDIGHIDLVCQLGSPRRISTFLQRVGRSGHTIRGTPKGRVFPLSRDDLVECVALIDASSGGALDRLIVFEKPLDVLAQQIVAEVACEDWSVDDLYQLVTRAYPYRELPRLAFDEVIQMTAQGFATRRGRRGALVHYDGVNKRVRGRRHARLVAMTAGGAIPDNADYRVVEEPAGIFIGTVNEDFAIESMAGDVFQLANASWRILQVNSGVVRVEDARGVPPNLPFWLGEAPGRSAELSKAVSRLRTEIEARIGDHDDAVDWLASNAFITRPAARQIVHYLDETKKILGVIPTQETIVLERFFDESGGMQLVIHAPFGSRVNRAWGLALRKRFCRQFNFELQAAATEEGLLLSLGPQHSFPLADVFRYLHPNTVRDVLVQALLDAPMFQTRWRWNVTLSLAVPRSNSGRKVPPPLQRMQAEDLLAAVFPDAAACLENIGGDREIPQHPLVVQAIDDCLTEAMDIERLRSLLNQILAESIQCVARDTPEPSPLAHEILNAQPYAFLDDAPLEERRAQAVYTRRALEPSSANELGALDVDAITRVADEAWPNATDVDELHDALLTSGFFTAGEVLERGEERWVELFDELRDSGRATAVTVSHDAEQHVLWCATERVTELRVVFPESTLDPMVKPPDETDWDRADAVRALVRGRIEITGVTTARALASTLGIDEKDIDMALLALEREGVVLRGTFTPHKTDREWCDRRLLARIHRYTLNRLRSEIEPVSAADFMRFLFAWQHVDPDERVSGPEGLAAIIAQLDGYEVQAGAWEPDVLATRSEAYDPLHLDALCLTGRVAWGRLSPPLRPGTGPFSTGPVRTTPIALFLRAHAATWLQLASASDDVPLSTYAKETLVLLQQRGASFFQELVTDGELLGTQVEQALGELVALGIVTADSFAGLRALLTPSNKRNPLPTSTVRPSRSRSPFGVESAGRWSLLHTAARPVHQPTEPDLADSSVVQEQAMTLLRRYGVVFRRLLARETNLAPWRDLVMVYRRLEARGEIRGGRFVAGMSGEHFALPEAVGQLRRVRRSQPLGQLLGISAADPLNLVGIVTPGDRIPALAPHRIVYRDGVPIAALEAGRFRQLTHYDQALQRDVERAAVRRRIPPTLKAYLGKVG